MAIDFAALAKAALPCVGRLHLAEHECPAHYRPAVEAALREAYAVGKRAAFEEAVNVARRHISDASKITASYGRAVYESCECVKDDLTALLADVKKPK